MPPRPMCNTLGNLKQLCHKVLVPDSSGRPVLQCCLPGATPSHTLGPTPTTSCSFSHWTYTAHKSFCLSSSTVPVNHAVGCCAGNCSSETAAIPLHCQPHPSSTVARGPHPIHNHLPSTLPQTRHTPHPTPHMNCMPLVSNKSAAHAYAPPVLSFCGTFRSPKDALVRTNAGRPHHFQTPPSCTSPPPQIPPAIKSKTAHSVKCGS